METNPLWLPKGKIHPTFYWIFHLKPSAVILTIRVEYQGQNDLIQVCYLGMKKSREEN